MVVKLKRHYPRASGRERGVALLAVVVVLSTLLVVGVLFAVTVDLDLKASRYYRDTGQAEQIGLEGLHRAIAEIQYDMWGVNEDRAFLLANQGREPSGKAVQLKDAAYRSRRFGPIVRPRAKWRQTVERIGAASPINVLTDYRWAWYDDEGTTADLMKPGSYVHAGGIYHDEFLPEHTDNADAWELGLHINRGDVYFEGEPPRSYKSDDKITSVYGASYWNAKRTQPWNREWDYIDTRINGDSFYKIFRFELVARDGSDWKSTYAGVQSDGTPMPRSDWLSMKTHLSNAAFPGGYARDSRGGALNLNQVNNNYRFETYRAQRIVGEKDPDKNPYVPFHYKDSKWIDVYGTGGAKRGRYAVLVWGDCGTPNANYMYDALETKGAIKNTADYFRILDASYSPRGGSIGNVIQGGSASSGPGADIIKSDTGGNWHRTLGTAIAEHVRGRAPISSRAELNMFLRKTGGNGALDRTQVANGASVPDVDADAEVIASLVSVHAYENLMGPHWEADRLIIDALGYNDAADVSRKYVPRQALASDSSFIKRGTAGADTRKQFMNYLEDLKFYWGPDYAREFRTRHALAIEALRAVRRWFSGAIRLLADGAYNNKSVVKPARALDIHLVSRLRRDARLRAVKPRKQPKSKRGRKPTRGCWLPKLKTLARGGRAFRTERVKIYGKTVTLRVREFVAYWPALGCVLKVVITRDPKRKRRVAYLTSTDLSMSAAQIIESFAQRWSIEQLFAVAKNQLGLDSAEVRKENAVRRHAAFCMALATWVQVWAYRFHPRLRTRSFAAQLAALREDTIKETIFASGPRTQESRRIACTLGSLYATATATM